MVSDCMLTQWISLLHEPIPVHFCRLTVFVLFGVAVLPLVLNLHVVPENFRTRNSILVWADILRYIL